MKFEILRIYVLFCCIEELMKNALFERVVRGENTEDLLPYYAIIIVIPPGAPWCYSKPACNPYINRKKNLCGEYGGCGV